MNEEELQANEARTKSNGKVFVRNLNSDASFLGIWETAKYDAVLCCVGVQYLEEPESVFAEVGRILKPGGLCIVSFTSRFFYQKALTGWMERGMAERARLVTDYLRAAGGFREDSIQIRGDGTSAITQLMSLGWMAGDPFVAVVARRNDSK
jgi:ubiquinone/menaquinone biosynthesis C-methylase UbiE